MERLTERIPYGACEGVAVQIDCPTYDCMNGCLDNSACVEKLAAYEDTGLTPEEIKEVGCHIYGPIHKEIAAYRRSGLAPERVAELAAAERDGRLVVLPCKTIFDPGWDAGPPCAFLCPERIEGETEEPCHRCRDGMPFVHERPCTQDDIKNIGKTVFLTRAEAEAALAKMQEGY
ncbi:MAG: hypothetical protein FWE08_03685 [Oscillospiraceae bacterium]|nr:hypothetical protein [Oscillospiraceae bacterium]